MAERETRVEQIDSLHYTFFKEIFAAKGISLKAGQVTWLCELWAAEIDKIKRSERTFGEAEAYRKAAQVAEDEKVDYEATQQESDLAYNTAIDHVKLALERLAQEAEERK